MTETCCMLDRKRLLDCSSPFPSFHARFDLIEFHFDSSAMASSPYARHEVDAAKARLAVAQRLAASSSEVFGVAAKTAGFAQLAANQLGTAGLGKTLFDSATKTMELAQAECLHLQKEVAESEKELLSVKQKWGLNVGREAPVTRKRRNENCDDLIEMFNGGSDNTHSDRAKKNKINTTDPVTNPFGTAGTNPTKGISFGSVPADLPTECFVFGANSAVGGSIPPTGKRNSANENSTSNVAQAPKAVLESRKILKASRNWTKNRTPSEVNIASNIFASVKLAPSTTTDVKTEEQSDTSGPVGGVSAKQSVAFAFTSSSNKNENGENVVVHPGHPDKARQEENNEEEVVYEVRARRFKRVGDEWKKYDAGDLCLYRHKSTSDCSMVMRNAALQVQFNVRIANGMKFHKVIKETEKGKSAFVRFAAVEDVSRGMDTFMLQVKPEFMDELYGTLEVMSKSK